MKYTQNAHNVAQIENGRWAHQTMRTNLKYVLCITMYGYTRAALSIINFEDDRTKRKNMEKVYQEYGKDILRVMYLLREWDKRLM